MISLTALVDFPLQITSIQLDVSVLLGLAWSSPDWNGSEHLRPRRIRVGRGAGISLRQKRVNLP
jgi:hypothetical protein